MKHIIGFSINYSILARFWFYLVVTTSALYRTSIAIHVVFYETLIDHCCISKLRRSTKKLFQVPTSYSTKHEDTYPQHLFFVEAWDQYLHVWYCMMLVLEKFSWCSSLTSKYNSDRSRFRKKTTCIAMDVLYKADVVTTK